MEMALFLDIYVKSKDMKKYLTDIEHVFNLQEQATIIQNSRLPIQEKHSDLLKIANEIEDSNIRKQILERLEYDGDAIRLFAENKEGFVYALIYQEYELDDIISGYYGSFEMAYQTGIGNSAEFKIEKYQIIYEDTEIIYPWEITSSIIEPNIDRQVTISPNYSGYPVAGQCFNEKGDLIFYWSSELPIERVKVVENLSNKRFENMYVTIPNPFLDGTKVKTLGGKEYHGLISMGEGFWTERDNRAKKEDAIEDYSDADIIIDVIDETEYCLHIHVNPFLIERI